MIWGYHYFWKHPYVSRSYNLFSLFAGWQMAQHHTTPKGVFLIHVARWKGQHLALSECFGLHTHYYSFNVYSVHHLLIVVESLNLFECCNLRCFSPCLFLFKDIMLNHHLYSMGSTGSTAPQGPAQTGSEPTLNNWWFPWAILLKFSRHFGSVETKVVEIYALKTWMPMTPIDSWRHLVEWHVITASCFRIRSDSNRGVFRSRGSVLHRVIVINVIHTVNLQAIYVPGSKLPLFSYGRDGHQPNSRGYRAPL